MNGNLIDAKIVLRHINGANGVFPSATLTCAHGDFICKDKLLEPYPEGTYDCKVVLGNFFMADYNVPGKKIVEQRVTLLDIQIETYDEQTEYSDEADKADPLATEEPELAAVAVEEAKASTTVEEPKPAKKGKKAAPMPTADDVVEIDEALCFGEELEQAILAREPVLLDTTHNRIIMRMQRDFLAEIGYVFDVRHQMHVYKGEDEEE